MSASVILFASSIVTRSIDFLSRSRSGESLGMTREVSFSVNIEAAAWEIAQPVPENLTSEILPSENWRSSRTRSPHSGLSSSALTSGWGSVPEFLGFQ